MCYRSFKSTIKLNLNEMRNLIDMEVFKDFIFIKNYKEGPKIDK